MLDKVTQFLGGLPTPALIALVILAIVQLSLQIWAIVDLLRRNTIRPDRKPIWLLIIVGASLLGPILYFALGRGTPALEDPLEDKAAARERWEAGLDKLYRDRERRE